jgi:hypothetical protein
LEIFLFLFLKQKKKKKIHMLHREEEEKKCYVFGGSFSIQKLLFVLSFMVKELNNSPRKQI